MKAETAERVKGDADVHARINGIYKMGAGQLLGLLFAIIILLVKR